MRSIFFHRVLVNDKPRDYTDLLDPTFREFEALVRRLSTKLKFVSTSALIQAYEQDGAFPPRWIHLSFDDGFSSTLVAAEICERHNVPLTVFPTSSVIEGAVPWFVKRMVALLSAERPVHLLGRTWDLRKRQEALAAHNAIKDALSELPCSRVDDRLSTLLSEAGLPECADLPEKLRFLNRNELRQLASYAEIGSHGLTHVPLHRCPLEELDTQLEQSLARLRMWTGQPISALSYPDGRYTPTVAERAGKAGYKIAFTASPRAVSPGSLFTHPREGWSRSPVYDWRSRAERLLGQCFGSPAF